MLTFIIKLILDRSMTLLKHVTRSSRTSLVFTTAKQGCANISVFQRFLVFIVGLHGFEGMSRHTQQRQQQHHHISNMRGGLDITLIDSSNSALDFLNLPKNQMQMSQNGLRFAFKNFYLFGS